MEDMVPEGWKFHTEEFVSKDISSDGKRWDENLNGFTCDWLALSPKIKMWNCGNGNVLFSSYFVLHGIQKEKRQKEITPLFGG